MECRLNSIVDTQALKSQIFSTLGNQGSGTFVCQSIRKVEKKQTVKTRKQIYG